MPVEEDLPDTLRPLVDRNAVHLAHERFGSDAEGLIKTLTKVVAPAKRGWLGTWPKITQPRQAVATRSASPAKRRNFGPISLAILFAVAVPSTTFRLAILLMPGAVTTSQALIVMIEALIALLLATLLAAVFARTRGNALTGSEICFLWLGWALTLSLAVGFVFVYLYWFPGSTEVSFFTGLRFGLLVGAATGMGLLLYWRRRKYSSAT